MTKDSFDKMLVKAIDEALLSLGKAARDAILKHLRENYGITKRNIPQKIGELSDALDKIFGLSARNLEILFMVFLYARIGIAAECITDDWIAREVTFQEYVRLMKNNFEGTSKSEGIGVILYGNEIQEQCKYSRR